MGRWGRVESVEVSRGLAHAARIHQDLGPTVPLLWPRSSIQGCLTPSRRPHIFVQICFVSFERWARLADWLAGLLDKRDKARAEEMYFISSLLHASSLSVSLSPLRFGKAASLTLGLPSSTSFSDKGPSLGTSIL